MKNLAFFDTNVLLYADDADSPVKRGRAIALFSAHVRAQTAVLSLQVLQEYYAAATRKLRIPAEFAQRKVEILKRLPTVRLDGDDVVSAIELHRLHGVSFWDALIVHAARRAHAEVVYSEDLQAGAAIGGVTIVNPFS